MNQPPPLPKIVAIVVIVAIMALTLWMHWQSIQEKLLPDYGTDPYVLGESKSCEKKIN